MDLQTYQKNALRTESIVETVEVNPVMLKHALALHKLTGMVLDGIKRSIYYNNDDRIANVYDLSKTIQVMAKAMSDYDYSVKHNVQFDSRVLHGAIGVCTESGEIAEAVEEALTLEKPLDSVNMEEEMHDISWYFAILNDSLGLTWEDGLEKNINKLKIRFPDKFSDEDAAVRDLNKEREALEGKTVE